MKKLQVYVALALVLGLSLAGWPAASTQAALAALPAPVQRIYDRTDKAVLENRPGAAWLWGPRVQDSLEDYKESPGGKRQVFYFEKGRLEITDPAKDPNDKYYVTSGLLLREMITGQFQTSDGQTVDQGPANVPLAGDLAPGVKDSPTYASLSDLVSFDGKWKSNDVTGQSVAYSLGLGGAVALRPDLAQGVTYAQYYPQTGHNVAKPFVDFMNKTGEVYVNGKYQANQPVFDPLYVFGLPISEPYWAHVTVGGKEQNVLVQAFERRLLTYTPGNPDPYKVELGNLGLAYVQWRYKTAPTALNNVDPGYARPTATDGFNLYNAANSNMQKLTAVKRAVSLDGKVVSKRQYQAPDRAFLQDAGTYKGQPATRETIFIAAREYQRLVLANGTSSSWYYADVPAFSWPLNYSTYHVYSLNDWALNWTIGGSVAVNKETARSLNVNFTDIDGSVYNAARLVSDKSGLLLGTGLTQTAPDNTKISQADAYTDYNVPNNIQAPGNAIPASDFNSLDTSGFKAESLLTKNDPDERFLKESSVSSILVKFKPNAGATLATVSQDYPSLSVKGGWQAGGSDLPSLFQLNGADMDTTLTALRADPRVLYASPNYVRHSTVTQFNDPQADSQYYLKAVHAPRAWDTTTGAKGITVAVIDSGADVENPDLKGNIAESYNSTNNSPDVTDLGGHGSWTTGIIGAVGNNSVYGSGVAWNARLLVIKASTDDNPDSFSDDAIITAIHQAVDRGARVINMSLGSSHDDPALRDAVKYATDKGVIVVVAAGNAGDSVPEYPASYPKVIAVGATGYLGQPTYFSSYGSDVTLAAPGLNICNTIRLGKFACADGTSASAPIVSGAAALLLSINPNLDADHVRAILIASAQPAPGKAVGQRDDHYGYGTLDLAAAVRMAATNQYPALP